jgi:hypothetical protein
MFHLFIHQFSYIHYTTVYMSIGFHTTIFGLLYCPACISFVRFSIEFVFFGWPFFVILSSNNFFSNLFCVQIVVQALYSVFNFHPPFHHHPRWIASRCQNEQKQNKQKTNKKKTYRMAACIVSNRLTMTSISMKNKSFVDFPFFFLNLWYDETAIEIISNWYLVAFYFDPKIIYQFCGRY